MTDHPEVEGNQGLVCIRDSFRVESESMKQRISIYNGENKFCIVVPDDI